MEKRQEIDQRKITLQLMYFAEYLKLSIGTFALVCLIGHIVASDRFQVNSVLFHLNILSKMAGARLSQRLRIASNNFKESSGN